MSESKIHIDLDEIDFFDEDIHPTLVKKIRVIDRSSEEARVTTETMTIFEYARIVGARAAQFDNLARPHVDSSDVTDSIELAIKELEAGKTPLKVQRKRRDGLEENWSVNEMILPFH